ncbi:MAG: cation transporter, partial [Polaromonas sp.]
MQTASLSPLSLQPSSLTDEPPVSTSCATPLAMLDNPDEWSAFSRSLTGQPSCWESSVVFEGMHCAACALTIEDALRKVPGVLSADISAASH